MPTASTIAVSTKKTTGSDSTQKPSRSSSTRIHPTAASTEKAMGSDSSRRHTTAASTKKTAGSDLSRSPTAIKTIGSGSNRSHATPASTSQATGPDSNRSRTTVASTKKIASTVSSGKQRTDTSAENDTTSISTLQEASSPTSRHNTIIATTRDPIRLTPTRGQFSSTSAKQQSSMVTATERQSASLPHPTAATRTKILSSLIETIITGSMGAIVTYVATRDPKYTTNTRTTTTTNDNGDNVIIYPSGWRWIPIGLPQLKFPPLKFPSPPALNPDPESRDRSVDNNNDNKSKSTTKSAECSTTKPPQCTKTVSYISKGRGFTSTILGTCSPVSGCVSGEQSTTTTTITTSIPIIWSNEPFEPDVDAGLKEIDDETIQYFYDLFKKQSISLEEGRDLVAHCRGNRPDIPLFCLNSFTSDFCQEVEAEPAKSLSKSFTGLGRTLGPIGPIDPLRDFHFGMQKRRLLSRGGLCSDWSFEFNWSGAKSECAKSCLDYMGIIKKQCLRFKTNDEGSLDTGCGTYSLAIKSVPSTSTTERPSDPTTTEPPPEFTGVPKTPLELKPVVCEDEASFPGHGDVRKGDQRREAKSFCETYFFDGPNPIYMGTQNETVWATTHFIQTNLFFSVSWIDDCETTVDRQNAMLPVGDDKFNCLDILVKTYTDCKFPLSS
ncbi:hypothetical protein V8C42DRAFT_363834 [Trichoderma barbatum]